MLGGGYVSVWAYRSLAKQLRSELMQDQVKITVICPNTHHVFHGWTAETLTGVLQDKHQTSSLSEVMPLAHFVRGTAEAIETDSHTIHVHLQDGNQQMVRYDHLLIGTGAYDNDAIDGIQEYGYQVKSPDAFHRTRNKIQQLVQMAANEDAPMASQLLRFTVAGGGFTGVELATNLAEYLQVVKKQYPSLQTVQPTIQLINSGRSVLSAMQPSYKRLIRYAEQQLDVYGIEVFNNCRITKVTDTGVFLDNDSFISSSLTISTIGQRRGTLKGTQSMERDELQRLLTNPYQQVVDYPNIWGGGDACHVKHHKTGEACPANALWAIKHGEYVGKNIARAIKGKSLKPFTYNGLGQSASLGLGKGITELYGLQFTGGIAWLMRWFFFNYFMPSRRTMIRAVGDWMFLLVRRKRKGLERINRQTTSVSIQV
ncbi:NAD(P)/FAD-dependent oxidoreductase [Spirosoma knui]